MSCSASCRQTRSKTSRSPRSSPCTSASSSGSSCDPMGLREKARKSLAAREAGDEEDESLVVHVDVARIESEAKTREEQLKKELHEARKLSDAKGAQIAQRDDVIEGLERRVKELGSAQTAAEREAKRAVEAAQKQLEAAREEIAALRKAKASAAEAGATIQKVEKKISALETKEDALRKREGEVEALVSSLDARSKELNARERSLASLREKLEAQDRETALATEITKARAGAEQERERASRLRGEVEDLRKRAGKAGELSEKE